MEGPKLRGGLYLKIGAKYSPGRYADDEGGTKGEPTRLDGGTAGVSSSRKRGEFNLRRSAINKAKQEMGDGRWANEDS